MIGPVAGTWERVQVEANQDGGIQEVVRGSRVDQRLHENGRLARNEEVHQEGKVAGGGEGEGGGREGKVPPSQAPTG